MHTSLIRSTRATVLGALLAAIAMALSLGAAVAGAATPDAWSSRTGLDSAQYQAEYDAMHAKGYTLQHVSGYTVGGAPRFAGVWTHGTGTETVGRHNRTQAEFQADFNSFAAAGYVPIEIDGYDVGGQPRYAAVFEKSTMPTVARHGISPDEFKATFYEQKAQGYSLRYVSEFTVAGTPKVAAVWQKDGEESVGLLGHTHAEFQAKFDELKAEGFQPLDIDGYEVNGLPRYAAVFKKRSNAFVARHNVLASQYQALFDATVYMGGIAGKAPTGFRPMAVNGYTVGGSEALAAVFAKD